MKASVLARLCCPVCRGSLNLHAFQAAADGTVEHGVVHCTTCRNWYPLEDAVLELLPPGLAYLEDRWQFWSTHQPALRQLGLAAPPATVERGAFAPQLGQQEHFDWYAANGRQSYSAYERLPFWRAFDERVFADWRTSVRPGGWLLDMGCAQGRSAFPFADLPLQIVGFDVSKALVRQAAAVSRQQRCRAEMTFFVGDAAAPPVAEASFDCVLVYGVLHHLPDPAAACRAIARILRPGGVYLGCENNVTVFRRLFDLCMKLCPIWHEEAGAQPLLSMQELREWFAPADVAIDSRSHVFVLPHLVNVLGRTWGARLLHLTEWLGRRLPLVRNQGGLLLARGVKAA